MSRAMLPRLRLTAHLYSVHSRISGTSTDTVLECMIVKEVSCSEKNCNRFSVRPGVGESSNARLIISSIRPVREDVDGLKRDGGVAAAKERPTYVTCLNMARFSQMPMAACR